MTIEEAIAEKGYIVYVNVGKSMMPLLRERKDLIEIRKKDPNERCKRYDVVLYKRGDMNVLHRVLKVREKDYVICGDHNIRREYGITDDQIIGVMTKVIRDGKSISTRNWKYRVYVHLWCDFFHARVAILYAKMIAGGIKRRVRKILRPSL